MIYMGSNDPPSRGIHGARRADQQAFLAVRVRELTGINRLSGVVFTGLIVT